MSHDRLVSAYRLAVRLYPRSFREDMGDDLVRLFADQLADERAPRVVARTVLDLALSVPQRHLESDMHLTRASVLPVVFFVLALSALLVGLVVGHPVVLGICALVALACVGLALVALRRARPLSELHDLPSRWWVVLTTGVVLFVGLVVATTITGELPSGGWFLAMVTGLAAIVLMAAGVVLGAIHLLNRGHRRAATSH
jgi:hypothetical protein